MTPRRPAHTTPTNSEISAYWDLRIHDTVLSQDPPGSLGFYAAMDAYRYGRLDYLSDLVDFEFWRARDVLDLGCGAGLDLVRFARAGARVMGLDLSARALAMAGDYLRVSGLNASLMRADAAQLPFVQASFDLVFCHGVLSFVRDEKALVEEIRRILRPDGTAILMVYNRHSAMYMAHRIAGLPLGHADAPGFRTHSRAEFEALLAPFGTSEVRYERLPARTSQRSGPRVMLFNTALGIVRRVLPETWFQAIGWHLIAKCSIGEKRDPGFGGDVFTDDGSKGQR